MKTGKEILVNEVWANIPVDKELPKEEALKLGAMALFGENMAYRQVVIMDPFTLLNYAVVPYVGHTGMIGLFTITSESAQLPCTPLKH
jgi:alanyl-tRNA synthetase